MTKLASLLCFQQMELAACEVIFCNWRWNALPWISILQVNRMLDTRIHGMRNMQNPTRILSHRSKQDIKEAGGGFTYFRLHFSNQLTICWQFSWNKFSQSRLVFVVQTGFSKESCLPWLKPHCLDVLIDRTQKVIQMASSKNVHKQWALPTTSLKPSLHAFQSIAL